MSKEEREAALMQPLCELILDWSQKQWLDDGNLTLDNFTSKVRYYVHTLNVKIVKHAYGQTLSKPVHIDHPQDPNAIVDRWSLYTGGLSNLCTTTTLETPKFLLLLFNFENLLL